MAGKVAVVQKPPVTLDRTATIAQVVADIGEAAANGTALIVFPEAYVPGYPAWVWRVQPGRDMSLSSQIHNRLRENAVDLSSDHLAPVYEAAWKHKMTVVLGIHELDFEFSGSTLFNTVVVIGPDGAILNRHRKLMPTNPERMVWGFGDARGLKVVDTPVGRLGVLICWENYMPLSRYALYAQNMEILVAPTWDCGDEWIATMKHIAREGGCWVIGAGTAMQGKDLPSGFPEREKVVDEEDWLCDGDAVLVRPFGKITAGPLHRERGVLYGEIEREAAARSRRTLDVTGHYSRPDIFRLQVSRAAMPPVEFHDE
ncbi:MAG: carbon-nitrogen hydrolase family protein [Xanthobacteraceae bacterium]